MPPLWPREDVRELYLDPYTHPTPPQPVLLSVKPIMLSSGCVFSIQKALLPNTTTTTSSVFQQSFSTCRWSLDIYGILRKFARSLVDLAEVGKEMTETAGWVNPQQERLQRNGPVRSWCCPYLQPCHSLLWRLCCSVLHQHLTLSSPGHG